MVTGSWRRVVSCSRFGVYAVALGADDSDQLRNAVRPACWWWGGIRFPWLPIAGDGTRLTGQRVRRATAAGGRTGGGWPEGRMDPAAITK